MLLKASRNSARNSRFMLSRIRNFLTALRSALKNVGERKKILAPNCPGVVGGAMYLPVGRSRLSRPDLQPMPNAFRVFWMISSGR